MKRIKTALFLLLAAGLCFSPALAEGARDRACQAVYHAACSGEDALKQHLSTGAQVDTRDDDGETPLMKAADHGVASAVEALLRAGADPNARDEDGETALMMAADEGNIVVVKLLLAAGADIHARDKDGETALSKALEERRIDIVELLRKAGAK